MRQLGAALAERCPPGAGAGRGWGSRGPRTAIVAEVDCRYNDCPSPVPSEGGGGEAGAGPGGGAGHWGIVVEEYPTIVLYPAAAALTPTVYTGTIAVSPIIDFREFTCLLSLGVGV
jgi:hypothetical protein